MANNELIESSYLLLVAVTAFGAIAFLFEGLTLRNKKKNQKKDQRSPTERLERMTNAFLGCLDTQIECANQRVSCNVAYACAKHIAA